MDSYNPRARVGGLPTPPADMYNYRGNGQYSHGCRKNVYDASNYPTPAAPMMYNPPMQYSNMPGVSAPGLSRVNHFGPVGQPTLPPLVDVPSRQHARSDRQQPQESRRQVPSVKQEKVVGGVSQELDYEMDQMTDYVAEMAQEIIMPRSKVTPPFRKFVSGILSSTRLPSSTILLGLNYLSKRMGMMATSPQSCSESTVYMLTVALLLGSKFLDDNTFQNRSWSEVSGIAVAELNRLEQDWLKAISWNLHVNFDKDSDFQCWLASWASWKEQRNRARAIKLERLAPLSQIDTNIRRHSQYQPRKEFSPAAAHNMYGRDRTPPSYQTQSRYEPQPWLQSASDYSPPSAPETGPNTPDWAMQLPGAGLPPPNWYQGISSGYGNLYSNRPSHRSSHVSYGAPMPPYQQYASQSSYWGAHPAGCGCSQCYSAEPYFHGMSHHGYGQQTVVG